MTTIRILFATESREIDPGRSGIVKATPVGIDITPEIQSQILAPLVARVEALEQNAHVPQESLDAFRKAFGKTFPSAPVDTGSRGPLCCPNCGSSSQVWSNNRDPVMRCHRFGCDGAEAVLTKPADAGRTKAPSTAAADTASTPGVGGSAASPG